MDIQYIGLAFPLLIAPQTAEEAPRPHKTQQVILIVFILYVVIATVLADHRVTKSERELIYFKIPLTEVALFDRMLPP
jgi:hypothetical protein